MLSHAAQSGQHPNRDRGVDLYETPAVAVEALLRVESLPHWLWEPAAGRGAIVKVLRAHGRTVISSDIVRYDFPLDFVADFLMTTEMPTGCCAIITNAPFKHLRAALVPARRHQYQLSQRARRAHLEPMGRQER